MSAHAQRIGCCLRDLTVVITLFLMLVGVLNRTGMKDYATEVLPKMLGHRALTHLLHPGNLNEPLHTASESSGRFWSNKSANAVALAASS